MWEKRESTKKNENDPVRREQSSPGLKSGIGFNIMHDGGHRAFSEHRWVNKLAAMTLDLIGASSHVWHWRHAMFHHNYVNVAGYDPDIDLGVFARFAPHQKRLWFHRW